LRLSPLAGKIYRIDGYLVDFWLFEREHPQGQYRISFGPADANRQNTIFGQ
jgi:hypothetical protein